MANPKLEPKEKCVLVVDDDDLIIELFREVLKSEGFQIESAFEGSSAIAKLKETKVDLIVLDLMLPNYSGYEILKKLQIDENTKSIPVIVITAKRLDHQSKQSLINESNVADFMEKPVNPSVITAKIHQVLNTLSRDEKIMLEKRKEMGDLGDIDENKSKLWE